MYAGVDFRGAKIGIIGHLQRMVHNTRGFTVNALTKYDAHFKRYAAKITHINAHLITLSDESSETMLLNGLKKNKEQPGPLSIT